MKIADMHCDTISTLFESIKNQKNGSLKSNHLHLDISKLQKGDYLLQNFAIFVSLLEHKNPLEYSHQLIDFFYQEIEKNKDDIGVVLRYADIQKNKEEGKISALLTVEEGGITKCDLAHLRNLYRLGVRMLTLTWNFENGIGYPNIYRSEGMEPDYKKPNVEQGLTEFGIEFIREMEKLGMIIDVSHLSDAGFYQVLQNTKKPFVASHSNARGICNHVRNLSDEMIRELGNRGGVMGMNFYPSFLVEGKGENEIIGSIADIVKHMKYIQNVGGYECIGLGSDFDGIPGHDELLDGSYLPLLVDYMKKENFTQNEIESICYKNVLRLYQDILV